MASRSCWAQLSNRLFAFECALNGHVFQMMLPQISDLIDIPLVGFDECIKKFADHILFVLGVGGTAFSLGLCGYTGTVLIREKQRERQRHREKQRESGCERENSVS